MDYLFMILILIIVFPLAFLAAVKVKPHIPPGKRLLIAFISAAGLVLIFVVIPLITSLEILFGPVGLGFMTAALLGILLGLGGPFKRKR